MYQKTTSLISVLAFAALLQVGCGGAGADTDSSVEQLSQECGRPPKPIVLVHGSFHGAWAWDEMLEHRVPKSLDVHAITLPGLGEDAANANPTISLQTHIGYVEQYLASHELRDVTLVVHSYAGMVGAGVLRDDAEGRVSKYVCIDCVVPAGGPQPHSFLEEAEFDPTQPPPPGSQLPLCTEPWQIKPFVAQLYGLRSPELVDYVNGHVTCQPGGTFVEPLVGFDPAVYQRVQATYVYTDYTRAHQTGPYTPADWATTSGRVGPWLSHDTFLKFVDRSVEFGFDQVTLEGAAHDAMISNPIATRATLFKIALQH